jgi:hypothetical protein
VEAGFAQPEVKENALLESLHGNAEFEALVATIEERLAQE